MKLQTKPIDMQRESVADELTTRVFSVRADTVNKDQRSVEAVIATEDPVSVYDWMRDEVIDEVLAMGGCELPSNRQLPLLDAHSRWSAAQVLGSTRELRIESDKLVGRNFFSKAAADAWTKTEEGHLTDNSVGYRVLEATVLEPGQSGVVNGRTFKAGVRALRVATRWQPRENSIVPIGADQRAKMREDHAGSAAREAGDDRTKESVMTFEKWLASRGLDPSKLTKEQLDGFRSDFQRMNGGGLTTRTDDNPAPAPSPAPAATPAPEPARAVTQTPADIERAVQARIKEIRELGRACNIDAEIIERACDNCTTVDEARKLFLDDVRSKRSVSAGSPPAGRNNERGTVGEQVLELAMMRFMVPKLDVARAATKLCRGDAAAAAVLAEESDKYRSLTLLDYARALLVARGGEIPLDRVEMFQRSWTTSSLPSVLGNIANKMLLEAYESENSTALRLFQSKPVKNFQAQTIARLSEMGSLQKVNADSGEIQNGTVSDVKATHQADTYGLRYAFTRRQIINDDINAFADFMMEAGSSSARLIDDLVWALILNNPTITETALAMFHTTHANLISGGSSALSVASLATMRQKFRQMKDIGGKKRLNQNMTTIVVSPELETTAERIVKSSVLMQTGSTDATYGQQNPFAGLGYVVEPRLSDTAFNSNASTTLWLALAQQRGLSAAVVISFLNGVSQPQVERVARESVSNRDIGAEFKVLFDVGADAIGYRGIGKSAGA